MAKIYSLTHPSSTRVYIGKTVGTLSRRLTHHLQEYKHSKKRIWKNIWVKSLVEKGLKPKINLIIEVPDDKVDEMERYYIKLGWQIAPNDMLNSPNCPGGEGFQKGKNLTKEARERSSKNRRKLTNKDLCKIADRVNSGEFVKNLAKEYGVNRMTIFRGLRGLVIGSEKIEYKANHPSGAQHHQGKLSEEMVNDMRKKYATKKYTQKQLASEFNVHQSLIGAILNNKIWKKKLEAN